MKKLRLDQLLFDRGLTNSREKAKALVIAGQVIIGDSEKITKPGTLVSENAEIRIKGKQNPYVSRGGLKLQGALDHFEIDPKGKTIMDVGASTGGFTDCLLQRGAEKVYAVDVGTNQLVWELRNNPKVVSLEKENFRHMPFEKIGEKVDLITMDVSFISIRKVVHQLPLFLKENGMALLLVKPQFEVKREEVGKKGVVKDPKLHERVIKEIREAAESVKLDYLGEVISPIEGPEGNKEYFLFVKA